MPLLMSEYHIKRVSNKGGFENTSVSVVCYEDNFELRKLMVTWEELY
ncbi:MAG: hypothetical protein HC896_01395 [Bacteroidales bacterium]|nr:hypothetical protein [Bacteroidales bacterium]